MIEVEAGRTVRMERGNAATKEKWRRILKEHEQSGLSASAFCQKNGHVFHQFRYWKQKQRRKSNELRFAPVVSKRASEVATPVPAGCLILGIGKARLEIRTGFDRGLLREVLAALEGSQ